MKGTFWKRAMMSFLALFFPWVVMLIKDNPGGTLLALFLQASIVGWPFASIWAWKVAHGKTKQKNEQKDISL